MNCNVMKLNRSSLKLLSNIRLWKESQKFSRLSCICTKYNLDKGTELENTFKKNSNKSTFTEDYAHLIFTRGLKKKVTAKPRVSLKSNTETAKPRVSLKSNTETSSSEATSLSHLFVPIEYKSSELDQKVGEEIAGPLTKDGILSVLNRFYTDDQVKELAREQGVDAYLYQHTTISFRKFCTTEATLPTDLHIVISDILNGATHIHDLYPYFYKHAKNIFPHLNCMDDLCRVSDLTQPPNWYPMARGMNRRIIFHAGPTNSGKTYHAMEQFLSAESGVYCGPLKLLAVEVFEKSNERNTPCDLITGEERKFAVSDEFPANHVACTVEMTSVNNKYEVAIIDEVQMIKDPQRGWAWTRAFLGICAQEIHVCGEGSAVDLIKDLAMSVGDDVEVRRYKRLTSLTLEETSLVTYDMVRPGDCIVCFGRNQIHKVSQTIERLGHEVAVIYGGLPPGAKLSQARKFNDPEHPCKIMVATDAIGMGINLSIRRIIFNTLIKPRVNENGDLEMEAIHTSQALQIAGRAGRYNTQYSEGSVTTLKPSDLPILRKILEDDLPEIKKGGLHPTADQIELFAFHLPTYTLSNLIDIFIRICTVDSSLYFMCLMDDFKFLADLIQHIPLQLRSRYVFCCAPISKKMPFVCAMFLKFARQYSHNEAATLDWLLRQVKWPFVTPKTIQTLVHLEEVFDAFDLYLWLSYRFPEMFPDADMVREVQKELDTVIQMGVDYITRMLKDPTAKIPSDLDQELKRTKSKGYKSTQAEHVRERSEIIKIGRRDKKTRESLGNRLLRQGILSRKMLEELQLEWEVQKEVEEHKNDDDKNS